jgi:hypothetical protein
MAPSDRFLSVLAQAQVSNVVGQVVMQAQRADGEHTQASWIISPAPASTKYRKPSPCTVVC